MGSAFRILNPIFDMIAFEIAAILVLLVLNGIFAMSEIAVVTARPTRLARRAEEGDQRAAAAAALKDASG